MVEAVEFVKVEDVMGESIDVEEEDFLVDGGKNMKKKFIPDFEDGKMVKMERCCEMEKSPKCEDEMRYDVGYEWSYVSLVKV